MRLEHPLTIEGVVLKLLDHDDDLREVIVRDTHVIKGSIWSASGKPEAIESHSVSLSLRSVNDDYVEKVASLGLDASGRVASVHLEPNQPYWAVSTVALALGLLVAPGQPEEGAS